MTSRTVFGIYHLNSKNEICQRHETRNKQQLLRNSNGNTRATLTSNITTQSMQFVTPAEQFKYGGDMMVRIQSTERIIGELEYLVDEIHLSPTMENWTRIEPKFERIKFEMSTWFGDTFEDHMSALPGTMMFVTFAYMIHKYQVLLNLVTIFENKVICIKHHHRAMSLMENGDDSDGCCKTIMAMMDA